MEKCYTDVIQLLDNHVEQATALSKDIFEFLKAECSTYGELEEMVLKTIRLAKWNCRYKCCDIAVSRLTVLLEKERNSLHLAVPLGGLNTLDTDNR